MLNSSWCTSFVHQNLADLIISILFLVYYQIKYKIAFGKKEHSNGRYNYHYYINQKSVSLHAKINLIFMPFSVAYFFGIVTVFWLISFYSLIPDGKQINLKKSCRNSLKFIHSHLLIQSCVRVVRACKWGLIYEYKFYLIFKTSSVMRLYILEIDWI